MLERSGAIQAIPILDDSVKKSRWTTIM